MKFRLVSDTHLEFMRQQFGAEGSLNIAIPPDAADKDTVLLLAGDFNAGYKSSANLLAMLCNRFKDVVLVQGNHEFYGYDINTYHQAFAECEHLPNAHFTKNHDGLRVDFDGVTVLATTLWTDMNRDNLGDHTLVGRSLNDFYVIKNGARPFNTTDAVALHDRARAFLVAELSKPRTQPVIVMTHHMPSWEYVAPQYRTSSINAGFAAHCDDLLDQLQPDYWVFGHTHTAVNTQRGKTRVLCNPFGYRHENGTNGFNPYLTFEL
jgi:3',5'-cyclic AMP phosphodiesterase CpdA